MTSSQACPRPAPGQSTALAQPLLALILAAACAAEPSRVLVVARDADGQHRLREVELSTHPDLETLTSSAIIFTGGGHLVVDGYRFQQAAPLDAAEARRLARGEPGGPVQLRYSLRADVAVPDDRESLLMVSAYHALEQVLAFLRPLDATLATRSTLEVCFHCTLDVDLGLPLPFLVSDNASYEPFADQLVLLPNLQLAGLPLAVDAEVLAHELSHRVFHHGAISDTLQNDLLDALVRQDAMQPADWRGYNLLRALDEGSSDFLAAAFAGRSRFGEASLGAAVGDERDLEGTRGAQEIYDATFEEAAARQREVVVDEAGAHQLGTGSWSPYHLGTLWAGSLWQMARTDEVSAVDVEVVRSRLAPALTQTERDLGAQLERVRELELGAVLDRLVANLPAGHRPRACAVLELRFAALMAGVTTCR